MAETCRTETGEADVIWLMSSLTSPRRRRANDPGTDQEAEAPASIQDVVRTTIDRTLGSVPPGQVITLGRMAPGLPELAVSRQLAVEVLASVLRNAMNSAQREIQLGVRQDQRHAVIEIQDDGPGFHPADVNEIFVPGVRALADLHAPIRVDRGLSQAHRLVRSVGGDLTAVADPAVGRVEIRLPLAV
jgi:signal transduction histidine kinase